MVRYGENSRRQRWRKYPHHGWPTNKKTTHKTIKCRDAIESDVKFRYLSSVLQIRTATAYRAK